MAKQIGPVRTVLRTMGWIPMVACFMMYDGWQSTECNRGRQGCPWDLPALMTVPVMLLGGIYLDLKLDPEYRLANKKKARYQALKEIHGETIAWKLTLDEFPIRGTTSR